MNTALGLIAAFLTSILFSGALIAALILGTATLGAGGMWWLWRTLGHK
jgi:hypothetical protein